MLKIFLGYAPGIGKTCAMLEAARRAKAMGVDVVIGDLGPDISTETKRLAEGLERLPLRKCEEAGRPVWEFNLNAALRRRPQLILVDELAHTNAPGCRHRKRCQDVDELLRAGISVYTTINVQNLESLNDVAAAVIGENVEEQVPDSVFDRAEQVELIDMDPDDLLQSGTSEGLTRQKLTILRELALRRTADRLKREAEESREAGALIGGEHVLIGLSSSPSNGKVIRTAARMAEAFHSGFTALYVETPSEKNLSDESRQRLRANRKLAEDLGARIATVYGDDPTAQIAEYARFSGVSKIVVGRSDSRRAWFSRRKNLSDRLAELAADTDIYIIPGKHPDRRRFRMLDLGTPVRLSWQDGAKMLLLLLLATGAAWLFDRIGLSEANGIMMYILAVLGISIFTSGWLYSVVGSLLSVMIFNFLFTEPRLTLHAYDASYPVTFVVMLSVGLIAGSLTRKMKQQARSAVQKAYRMEVMFQTSQKLQQAGGEQEILRATAAQLQKLLNRPVCLFSVGSDGEVREDRPICAEKGAAWDPDEKERTAARWAARNNKHAGATTDTFPEAGSLCVTIRGGNNTVFAVAVIKMSDQAELEAFDKNLLLAMLDECGMLLEKLSLDKERQRVEMEAEQERLRANLLRAISHDLRTPLTSISGNAGILMENSRVLDEPKKQELYTAIYDDAQWLINLVENLLSVTRIENGTMQIREEPELLEDVFREALAHLDRHAKEHQIIGAPEDDLLMARMDARLIVQVVINIVNNAVKYTPPGSRIEVSAKAQGEKVLVEIADDGPGISDEEKPKLFDMFYTAENERGDGRRGLGLGLALCRSIVQAHGGTIGVRDRNPGREPKGTVFYFTLERAEVEDYG